MNQTQREHIVRRGAETILLLLGCLIGWAIGLLAWLAVSWLVAGEVTPQWTGARLTVFVLAGGGGLGGAWTARRIIRAADRNTGRAQETP
jgi:hypothetical protein